MYGLAPVVIFVYSRPEHTKRAIESLAKNEKAKYSDIFIFSDGPSNCKDIENINKVRNYIFSLVDKHIFKSIEIQISENHKGLANSVISGVTKILNQFDKVIVLEDDLIVTTDYLDFMNEGLDYFKDYKEIWSISGYSPNIKVPNNYLYDIYFSYRGCSSGWGTWKDRWELIDWDVKDWEMFRRNIIKQIKFNRGGSDLSLMLHNQMKGKIDSWAIRWCYAQFKLNKLTVYPVKSKVKNIGMDGTGTHKVKSFKYDVDINNGSGPYLFIKPTINKKVIRRFKNFYRITIIQKIAWIKEIIFSFFDR